MPPPVSDLRVHALLLATLSAPSLNNASPESELTSLEQLPGFIPSLFRLSTSSAVSLPSSASSALPLAAAVYLKNLVRREWARVISRGHGLAPSTSSTLPPSDKDFLRARLVPAMAHVDTRVRAQFAEILKRIVGADFPKRYQQLMSQINDLLFASHGNAVEAGLIALRALANVYEFKGAALASRAQGTEEEERARGVTEEPSYAAGGEPDLGFMHSYPRAALNYVVGETFPRLLELMRVLEGAVDEARRREGNGMGESAPDGAITADQAFEMQKHVCKTFWSLTQSDLPLLLLRDLDGVFADWMNVFLTVLRRPLPGAEAGRGAKYTEDDIKQMPAWKAKQWVGHIVYRLFQRYGNPSHISPSFAWTFDLETLTNFGDFFRRRFAAPFTEVMFDLVSTDQRVTSSRVANIALLYLEHAVSPGITYKVIKPRLADLITKVIFQYMCISESDLAIWVDDPVEYVRKTYDVLEDFHTPRAAACSLLYVLSKQRRSAVVAPLLSFLVQIMDNYAEVTQRVKSGLQSDPQILQQRGDLARQKDGALLAIGTIRESLVAGAENAQYLSVFLNTHVMPEFDSDVPFLRARACWLYGHLTSSDYVPIELVLPGLSGLEKSLRDEEFPVRVRAAVDIRHYLQNKLAAEQIKPNIGDLLTLLFTLLDDIDNTDIVATIDQVIVGFPDQIAPFAVPLCSRLVETFSRAASAGQEDDEAGFAATQCLQALDSIVSSVSSSSVPDKIALLAEMEHMISDIFDKMFDEDRMELFEEALELLSAFIQHSGMERGNHVRACAEACVEPQESLLGLPKGPGQKFPLEIVCSDSDLRKAIEADALAGRGVVSLGLWSIFPRAMHAFHDWASDYSLHYLHLLDAYLSQSPRVLMLDREGETAHIQLLLGMISRLWDDTRLEEEDFAVQGSRVVTLFLQHCRDLADVSIDREVGVLAQLVVLRLRADPRSERVVTALLRSLAHLLYVSPVKTLTVIDQSLGSTEEVFGLWMSMVREDRLEWKYDRKTSAIALSSILGSDWISLPGPLRQSIPQLLLTIVKLLDSLASDGSHVLPRPSHCMGGALARPASDEGCNVAGLSFWAGGDHARQLSTPAHGDGAEVSVTPGMDKPPRPMHVTADYEEDLAPVTDHVGVATNFNDHVCERERDGENQMFCLLHDVDELLYFESVVRRLPPTASQQLTKALPSDETHRVQCTLHRAAELRTDRINDVAKV